MGTATKTWIDAAKAASTRVVKKKKKKKKKPENTDEATVYLIGNKIVNKITSAGKTKRKEKEHEIYKKFEYN